MLHFFNRKADSEETNIYGEKIVFKYAKQSDNSQKLLAYADKANTGLWRRYYIIYLPWKNVAVGVIARELARFV